MKLTNLVMIMIALFFVIFLLMKSIKMTSLNEFNLPLECGFKNMETFRSPFSVYMYMHVILFIILDLEVILIAMFNFSMNLSIKINFLMFLIFIMCITLMEWNTMILEWT